MNDNDLELRIENFEIIGDALMVGFYTVLGAVVVSVAASVIAVLV